MKKYLALLLAVLMVVALCAGCGGESTTDEPTDEPTADVPAADEPAGDADVPAAGDDWGTYIDYVCDYAAAGAPTEEDGAAVVEAIRACADMDELSAVQQMTVLFANVGVLTYDAWVAAGRPPADTTGVTGEGDGGEVPSGEAASGDKGEGAPSGEGGGAALIEPDYAKYSKDFEGYRQYCIDAFAEDANAPEDLKESTNAGLAAAVDETDGSITMLVDVGLIVDYATFIAG